MKKNVFQIILYFFLAVIILILGYLIGAVVLAIIGVIIVLIALFFLFRYLFGKSVYFFSKKMPSLFLKMVVCSGVCVGLLLLLWNSIIKPILLTKDYGLAITIIWTFCTIVFGTLWYQWVIKRRVKYTDEGIYEYTQLRPGLSFLDIFFMLIIPTIICFTIYFLLPYIGGI